MQRVFRIAPSPTGYLHLGHAKLFLINYALAKNLHGKLLYRVEDTDLKRNKEEAVKVLLDEIDWFGVELDGGPTRNGKNEYFQSQRLDIYKKLADELLEKGKAYKAYETPEERAEQIENQRKSGQSPVYSGAHRNLTPDQIEAFEKEGRKPIIRLKVEPNEEITFHDEVLGDITINSSTLGDIPIMKSDGTPMYNFCVAIDDHLMGITDVVRGKEHISNTPKQVLVNRAFGWELPRFAHWSVLLNENEPGKLSKRKGAKPIIQYRAEGFLPDAIFNYLIVVSFSFHFQNKDEEIMTRDEIISKVSIDKFLKTNARFNEQKLDWFNGNHIRRLKSEDFIERVINWLDTSARDIKQFDPEFDESLIETFLNNKDILKKALPLVQERVIKFKDIFEYLRFFFDAPNKENIEIEATKHSAEEFEIARTKLIEGLSVLNEPWTHESWEATIREIANELGWKHGDMFMELRLLIVGSKFSPPLYEAMEILGMEECLKRMSK